jgi:hypothetical protein
MSSPPLGAARETDNLLDVQGVDLLRAVFERQTLSVRR